MIRKTSGWAMAGVLALGMGATSAAAQGAANNPNAAETTEIATATADASAPSQDAAENSRHEKRVGSPFVELDSWVYLVLDRLAAMGYIHSDFGDTRPWSRIECARMVQEADNAVEPDLPASSQVEQLLNSLEKEFQRELNFINGPEEEKTLTVESLYSGTMGISGTPLNDSYHFGQTVINNYGRPYQEGLSSYDGFAGYAAAGRFTLYMRGELQHAPSAPAYPLSVRQAIASIDQNPLQPATPVAAINRFRLLDTYAAVNIAGWDITFGKQSLWWAPNYGGALMFSDNAEPIYMGRISRITPFVLPSFFHWLGPMKWDLFFGKLSGNEYPPRPLIHGEKVSFKPTENLELSFSRTSEFGGVGRALTPGAIYQSYVSFVSSFGYSASQNPGERNGGFDFSYRVPKVSNWLTVYGDLMSRDDPSPLDAPLRAAFNPGLYVAWIPHFRRLDLRVEAVNTNSANASTGGHFFYWESFYHDLYTNKGNLIGDWIGREGMGFQAWSTYWLGARNTIQLGYRHGKVARDFITGGETLNDGSASVNYWIDDNLQLSTRVQYEKWLAPILASSAQANWTTSIQLSFWPKSLQKYARSSLQAK